jgi:AcrR family transcriptional regulator
LIHPFPVARPVAADAEATRARILAAAVQLVSSRGIEGTTVRDVAAGAGVSLATVLHYFGSKEGLYGACVQAMDDELAALRAELLSAAAPGMTRAELLSRMVRRAWAFACAHRVAHRIILRMVLDHGGLPKDRLDTLLRPSLDDAESILAPLLDVSPLRARMSMQTLVQLVARYAICGDDELQLITGAADVVAAERIVGDHLTDLAAGLLLSPATRDAPAFPARNEATA